VYVTVPGVGIIGVDKARVRLFKMLEDVERAYPTAEKITLPPLTVASGRFLRIIAQHGRGIRYETDTMSFL